nr:MAG TPA: hypothetical protein [Caudoviricetes sp.]
MAVNINDYVGFGPSTDDSGTRHTINHLPVTADWEPDIYQIESGDYPMGGRNGIANVQANQLGNRTEYLKEKHEELKAAIEAIQPGTDKYDELLAKIEALDSAKENNRINHLERLVGNAYLALEMANIDPDGYDSMIVETFNDAASEIDQFVATVTSVVSGDDSVDVDDSSGLIIGAHYQLADGEHQEEVQIKSINVSGKIKRVVLYGNVKNQYTDGRAKLYRSSIAIYNGRAYGGGNTKTAELAGTDAFSGSNTKKPLAATVSLSDPAAFVVKGGHVKDGKIVMGTPAYGIALKAPGGTANGANWVNVNADGDALAQADLA